jgi:hypothetical protein
MDQSLTEINDQIRISSRTTVMHQETQISDLLDQINPPETRRSFQKISMQTAETNQTLRTMQTDIQEIKNQLQDLNLTILGGYNSTTEITVGSALEVSSTLGILYPHLARLAVASQGYIELPQVKAIMDELKTILADASTLAAHEIRLGIVIRPPGHPYRPSQHLAIQRLFMENTKVRAQDRSKWLSRQQGHNLSTIATKSVTADLPIGKLIISLDFLSRPNSALENTGARIFFLPTTRLGLYGLSAAVGHNVPRTVAIFGVQPSDSIIFSSIERGDVQSIVNLFSSDQARPNDRDEDGRSLLWVGIPSSSAVVC